MTYTEFANTPRPTESAAEAQDRAVLAVENAELRTQLRECRERYQALALQLYRTQKNLPKPPPAPKPSTRITSTLALWNRQNTAVPYGVFSEEPKPTPPVQPTATRRRLLIAFANSCFYCGSELSIETITIDHVVPRARGGSNAFTNKAPACFPCNNGKGDREPTAEELARVRSIHANSPAEAWI